MTHPLPRWNLERGHRGRSRSGKRLHLRGRWAATCAAKRSGRKMTRAKDRPVVRSREAARERLAGEGSSLSRSDASPRRPHCSQGCAVAGTRLRHRARMATVGAGGWAAHDTIESILDRIDLNRSSRFGQGGVRLVTLFAAPRTVHAEELTQLGPGGRGRRDTCFVRWSACSKRSGARTPGTEPRSADPSTQLTQ
jgi:hypothetical protein